MHASFDNIPPENVCINSNNKKNIYFQIMFTKNIKSEIQVW